MHKRLQTLEKEKKKWERSSVPVQTYQDLLKQMETQKAVSKGKIADLELKLRVMGKRLKEAEAGGKWKKLAEKLKEENRKLREALEMREGELADKNRTIESNQVLIEDLEKTIRELLDEKGMLVEENQKQADKIVGLEVENSMLKERLRLAEERANRLPEKTGDPEIDSLIDQMRELQEELKKERQTRFQEETKRKEKEKEAERLAEEVERLKKQLEGKDGEIIIIRETITIKEKEIVRLRKRVKAAEGFEEKLEDMEKEVEKKQGEVEKLRKKLDEEKAKNEGSEEEIEGLKKKLKEREGELEDMGRKVKNKDEEIEELERKIRNKDNEIEDMGRKVRNKDEEIEELERKVKNKDEEIEELERKLKQKEGEIEELERKNKQKDDEIEDLKDRLRKKEEMLDRLEEQLRVLKEGNGDQDEKMKQLERERDRLAIESENLRNKVRELKEEVKDRDGEIERLREEIKEKDEEIERLRNKPSEIVKVQETITIREKELIKVKAKRRKRNDLEEYEEYSEYEEEEMLKEGGVGGPRGRDDRTEMIERIFELERILERERVKKVVVKRVRDGLRKQRDLLSGLGDKHGGEVDQDIKTVAEKWDKRDQERDKQETEAQEKEDAEEEQKKNANPAGNENNKDNKDEKDKDKDILRTDGQIEECAQELEDYNTMLGEIKEKYTKEDPSKVDENYKFIVQGLHSDYVEQPRFKEREERKEFEEMMEDIQSQIKNREGVPEEYRNVLQQVHKNTGKEDFEKKEEKKQWEEIQNDIIQKMNEASEPKADPRLRKRRNGILQKTEDAVEANENARAMGLKESPRQNWKKENVDPSDEDEFLNTVGDYMDRNKETSEEIEGILKGFADLDYEGLMEIYHYMSLTDMFMTNTSKRYTQDKNLKARFKKHVSKNDKLLSILRTLSEMAKFLTSKITNYEPRHSKWLTVQSEQILFTKKIERKLDEFTANDKRGTIAINTLNTSMLEKGLDDVQENNHNRLEKIYNFLDQIIHVEQMDEMEIEDLNRRMADLRMALGRKNLEMVELIGALEETRGLAERQPVRSDWKEGSPGRTEAEIMEEMNRATKEMERINEETSEAIRMRDLVGEEEKESLPPVDTGEWEEVEKMAREQMLKDYKRLGGDEAPKDFQNIVENDLANVNMKKKEPNEGEEAKMADSVLIDESIIQGEGTPVENTKKYLKKIGELRDKEMDRQEEERQRAEDVLQAAKRCYEEQHITLEKGRQELIHQQDIEESLNDGDLDHKIPKKSRRTRGASEKRGYVETLVLTSEHIEVIEKYSLEMRELFKDMGELKNRAQAQKHLEEMVNDLKEKVKKGEVIVELASGDEQKPFQTDPEKPDWERGQDYLHELRNQDDQLESILRRQRKDLGDAKDNMTGVSTDLKELHDQAELTLSKQIKAYSFMTKRDIEDPIVKEDPDNDMHDVILKTKKKLGRVDYYIKKIERQLRTNEDLEYEDLSIIYHSLNSMVGFISSIASKKTDNQKFLENFDRKILRELGTLECLEIDKQFCIFVKSRFEEFKKVVVGWVKLTEENITRTQEIETHVDSLVLSQSLQFDMSKYKYFEESETLDSLLRMNLVRLQKIDMFIERVEQEGLGGGKEDEEFYIKLYRKLNGFKNGYIEFMEEICDEEFDGIRDYPKDLSELEISQVKGYILEISAIVEDQLGENSAYVITRINKIIKAKQTLEQKSQRLEIMNEDLEQSLNRRTQAVSKLLIKCSVMIGRIKALE